MRVRSVAPRRGERPVRDTRVPSRAGMLGRHIHRTASRLLGCIGQIVPKLNGSGLRRHRFSPIAELAGAFRPACPAKLLPFPRSLSLPTRRLSPLPPYAFEVLAAAALPAVPALSAAFGGVHPAALFALAAAELAAFGMLAGLHVRTRRGSTRFLALAYLAASVLTAASHAAPLLALGAGFAVAACAAVYVALCVKELLRWRRRALNLEVMLAEQLHRGEHHARRLEALWKLASQPPLDDDAFLRAVLVASSEGIHPGPEFHGVIAHVEGPDVVIDMNQDATLRDGALVPGARVPFADSLVGELLRAGKTCAWHDVRAYESLAAIPRVRTMPWRALV